MSETRESSAARYKRVVVPGLNAGEQRERPGQGAIGAEVQEPPAVSDVAVGEAQWRVAKADCDEVAAAKTTEERPSARAGRQPGQREAADLGARGDAAFPVPLVEAQLC